MCGRSLRGITFERFQHSAPYARAKSRMSVNRSTLFRISSSLWSMSASASFSTDSVSPVVPGLSGSKNSSTTSARSANHFTTCGKSYPRPWAASAASIIPGESTMNSRLSSGAFTRLSRRCDTSVGPNSSSGPNGSASSLTTAAPSRVSSTPSLAWVRIVNPSSIGASPVFCAWTPSSRWTWRN